MCDETRQTTTAQLFTIAQISAWLGEGVNSMNNDKPVFMWHHDSCKSTCDKGHVLPAIILDYETRQLVVHADLPELLWFAFMGLAQNTGLEFSEVF